MTAVPDRARGVSRRGPGRTTTVPPTGILPRPAPRADRGRRSRRRRRMARPLLLIVLGGSSSAGAVSVRPRPAAAAAAAPGGGGAPVASPRRSAVRPDGDHHENPELVKNATDGSVATYWETEQYAMRSRQPQVRASASSSMPAARASSVAHREVDDAGVPRGDPLRRQRHRPVHSRLERPERQRLDGLRAERKRRALLRDLAHRPGAVDQVRVNDVTAS